MRVTLMLVTSLDGRTTQGDTIGTSTWASAEDQDVFKSQKDAADQIIMGSTTYDSVRDYITPSADKPRVVLTSQPERYGAEEQPGLHFSADEPEDIIKQAEQAGYESVLLVGGAETNARFLGAKLIDEVLLTIEPVIFGSGKPFTADIPQPVDLQLISCDTLNDQGTILARYAIQHD